MPISIPRNYHLTSKGDDYIEQYMGLTPPGTPIGADAISDWFWWLRESENFPEQLNNLITKVGEEKAIKTLDWAVRNAYLEVDRQHEFIDDFAQTSPPPVPQHLVEQLIRERDRAKVRGDEDEYLILSDEIAKAYGIGIGTTAVQGTQLPNRGLNPDTRIPRRR